MARVIVVECRVIYGTTYAILHHDSEVSKNVTGYEGVGAFRYYHLYNHLRDPEDSLLNRPL